MGGIKVRILLLLLLLGLSWAETASLTKDINLSHTEALEFAVKAYNDQSKDEYAFDVLGAEPKPDWDPTLSKSQLLQFIIKETECKKLFSSKKCPFKNDGQVKICLGLLKVDEKGLTIASACEPQKSVMPVRPRRGLGKFFRKVKDMLKKLLPNGFVIPWTIRF